MPRKASVLHGLAGPDIEAREASPSRPRPRATVDDSDGEGGKWGVQRRGAGNDLPNVSCRLLTDAGYGGYVHVDACACCACVGVSFPRQGAGD